MSDKRIFLKGIDYFQLLIDHHNKRHGGTGHEARLAIYFNGVVDLETVKSEISSNELCNRLAKIRLSKNGGLGFPFLYFIEKKNSIPISFHQVESDKIPDPVMNYTVDVFKEPPLHIALLHFGNGNSCVLFTFHHILFDFAGVQSFINSLTGMKDIPLFPPNEKPAKFSIRFRRFFREVFFTFKEANWKMTVAERKLPQERPLKFVYRELSFTKEETARIFKNCEHRGLSLNRSSFLVGVVCKALHDEIFSKQRKHEFIWVPVPVNNRKKSNRDAILFNGLTFLYYKLNPEDLQSLEATLERIGNQLREQVRKELPQAFVDFCDGYWFMPMPFYYPMLNLPSWGKLSSLAFSSLGNTFSGLDKMFGLPVSEIKNYPANPVSPGFTFLFYEFRGTLRLMTSWVEGQYNSDEQKSVLSSVRDFLLKN